MKSSLNDKNNIINNNSINSSLSNSSSSEGSENENNLYDDYQGPYTLPSEDIINQEIKLKENNIIKIIKEKGKSLYKPKEKDNILINCESFYYNNSGDNEKIILTNFCNFKQDKEYNLNDKCIQR